MAWMLSDNERVESDVDHPVPGHSLHLFTGHIWPVKRCWSIIYLAPIHWSHVTWKTSPPHWWRGGGGGEGGREGDHDRGGQEALDKQYFSSSSNSQSSFQMLLTHRYIRLVGTLFCLLLATAALFSMNSNLFGVGSCQMSNCQMDFQFRWLPSHQMQDAQKTVMFVKSSQSGGLRSKNCWFFSHKNNMSKTEVAPWCYKWTDWIGLDWMAIPQTTTTARALL